MFMTSSVISDKIYKSQIGPCLNISFYSMHCMCQREVAMMIFDICPYTYFMAGKEYIHQ